MYGIYIVFILYHLFYIHYSLYIDYPSPNSVYNCYNPRGICLNTRLRLGLSHLREHRFKHGFQDMLNPLCSCGNDVEYTEHFLFHCPQFANERCTLLSTLGNFKGMFQRNLSIF